MKNEELDSVGTPESESSVSFAAKKRRIVMLLLGYSAVLGVLSCFLPEEDTPLDVIISFPLLLLGISWCFMDAAERGCRIGRIVQLLLVLLFIVGLPVYLFQTRGIGAFKPLMLAAVLVGAMLACLFVTAYATLYAGEATGLWEFAY